VELPLILTSTDIQSQLAGSEAPRSVYHDQPGYLEFPNETDPVKRLPSRSARKEPLSALKRKQRQCDKIPDQTTAVDYTSNVLLFDSVAPPRAFHCLLPILPTVTPCFYEFHCQESRSALPASRLVDPGTHHAYVVHPTQAQSIFTAFDFTPDAKLKTIK